MGGGGEGRLALFLGLLRLAGGLLLGLFPPPPLPLGLRKDALAVFRGGRLAGFHFAVNALRLRASLTAVCAGLHAFNDYHMNKRWPSKRLALDAELRRKKQHGSKIGGNCGSTLPKEPGGASRRQRAGEVEQAAPEWAPSTGAGKGEINVEIDITIVG